MLAMLRSVISPGHALFTILKLSTVSIVEKAITSRVITAVLTANFGKLVILEHVLELLPMPTVYAEQMQPPVPSAKLDGL